MITDSDLLGDSGDVKPMQHNPLEQFILLAKGTRAAACCDLIKTVLEAPGVYVFAELIALPNLQELESTPNAKYLHTLDVFAHGTYKDYLAKREDLIELTDVMRKKLRHLTIVSMAIENKCIAYEDLQAQLDIAFVRDLEDLIIEGIYADIIHGKLDQRKKQLEVDYTIGRDIKPDDVKKIADTLKEWCDSCESVLNTIENQIDRANSAKGAFVAHNEKIDQEVTKLKMALKVHVATNVEIDEEMAMDFKDSSSSNSSNTSMPVHDSRNKRPKPKMMKPTSATSGGSGVKLHR